MNGRFGERDKLVCPGSSVSRWGMALCVLIPALLVLSGCRLDDNRIRGAIKIPIHDFLNSTILNYGPAIANDSDLVRVDVQLINSNNTFVPNYRPEFLIVNGMGVTPLTCSLSDAEGRSTCHFRSTQGGVKRIRMAEAKHPMEHDIEFISPLRFGEVLGFISTGETDAVTGTYSHWGEFSLGDWVHGIRVATPETPPLKRGYVSVQGALTTF